MRRGLLNIVIGGQAGSESKGKLSGYLVDKYKVDVVAMSASPNAGHTIVKDGVKKVSYHLPIGAIVNETADIVLGPASLINPHTFAQEISALGINPSRIFLDERASIITPGDILDENEGKLSDIGSTLQGVGECRMRKMSRRNQNLVKDYKNQISNMNPGINIVPNTFLLMEYALISNKMILAEATQGFDLDLEHGIHPTYCFARGTRVLLADGTSERIEKIVRDRMDVEVLSVNKSSGVMEPKKITNWYKTPHDGEWYRVHTTMSPGDKSSVKCTGDHKWITHRGEVPARDLVEGDILYTNEPDIEGTTCEQVILGSLLGGGRISNNPSKSNKPSIQFETKQVEYLRYKADALAPFTGGSFCDQSGRGKRFDSNGRSSLLKYMDMRYPLNPDEILDRIDEIGMAIWYQDRGTLKGTKGSFTLYTNGWSVEDAWAFCRGLNDKFGLRFQLRASVDLVPMLYLDGSCSLEFFNMIGKYVHPSNVSKIPAEFRAGGFVGLPKDTVGSRPAQIKCTGVEKIPPLVGAGYRVKYNIEVADNHNYFAGNQFGYSLVGNCTSKMINTSMVMAELGVSPRRIGDVYGVFRPYPIRVNNRTGTSGPYADAKEITWEEVTRRSGCPYPISEITTTTKLPRRVFEFSWERFYSFCTICGPTWLCLQFANYLDHNMWGVTDKNSLTQPVKEMIKAMGNRCPVRYIGTGPEHHHMIDLYEGRE